MYKLALATFLATYGNDLATLNNKSVDGVLGTQTRGGNMVGADESIELWWHPMFE